MKVKIKKLHEDAIIPKYQTSGAAGFDLHALEDVYIPAGHTKLIKTGLSFEIPHGFELQIRPRSGLSLKTKLRVANSPATIDSDYRGDVGIIVDNIENKDNVFSSLQINKGDRIAQGVICPIIQAEFEESDELSDTSRGSGGFGSTN